MGYTHYFEFSKPKGVKAAHLEALYQTAIEECSRIARHWNTNVAVKGGHRDDERLSGFSAHTAPKLGYGGLQVNGKGENSHEEFSVREHFNQNEGFSFCKTARKPYDTVVTACLATLKHRLGDAIQVSSDGNALDWNEGVNLAREVLRLAIPNPIEHAPARLTLVKVSRKA